MKRLALCVLLAVSVSIQAKVSNEFILFHQGEYQRALPAIKVKANQGDKVALYYLGLMQLQGYATEKSESKGLASIKKSAERGYVKAQRFMGSYYLKEKSSPSKAFVWFKQAADKGDMTATIYTAGAYLNGFGVKKNKDRARRYMTKGAQKGNALAQYELSKMFLESRHRRSHRLGISWLKKAAKGGNQRAQIALSHQYADGRLLGRNPYKADEWAKKAMAQNTKETSYLMAEYLANSQYDSGGDKALSWYEKAYNEGHPDAAYHLAILYLSPNVTTMDDAKAMNLLEQAASHGDKRAMKKLVNLYGEGIRVTKNDEKKAKWQKKLGQTNLAFNKKRMMYWMAQDNNSYQALQSQQMPGVFNAWQSQDSKKDGVKNHSPKMVLLNKKQIFDAKLTLVSPDKVSMAEMFKYLRPIAAMPTASVGKLPEYPVKYPHLDAEDVRKIYGQARLGNRQAQFYMGQFHQQGIIVQKDDKLALAWYLQAAELNNLKAEYQLALMYLYGRGTEVSFSKALFWLNRAAFKGNSYSQYALGRIYQTGFGHFDSENYIAPDMKRAESMYFLASGGDNHYAKFELANLLDNDKDNSKLSPVAQKKRIGLITKLYEEAAKAGVQQAKLPLAFYLAASGKDNERLQWANEALQKIADTGDAKASLMVGLMYDRGLGVTKNTSKAVGWYQQALDKNNALSAFILGSYYYLGDVVSQDKAHGEALLSKSTSDALPFAYYNLAAINAQENKPYLMQVEHAKDLGSYRASLYLADRDILSAEISDKRAAVAIYQKYATLGLASAEMKLGYLYDKGITVKKDANKAYQLYKRSARQGNIYAQFLLGNLYQFAKLGTSEVAKAMYWYQKAAEKKFVPAYIALGVCYEKYYQNFAQSKEWLIKAQYEGSKIASYNLALIYDYGKGMKVNEHEGFNHYLKAANYGVKPAQAVVAYQYLNGKGVTQNSHKALEWFKHIASDKHPEIYYQLGMMYETGVGTSISTPQAISYYLDAERLGSKQALLALARIYQFGIGVPKDTMRAIKLYERAISSGSQYAKLQLAKIYLAQSMAGGSDRAESAPLNKKALVMLNGLSNANYLPAKQVLANMSLEAQDSTKPSVKAVTVDASEDRDSANLMYIDVISHLNLGQEAQSRAMLKRLVDKYPSYEPAKAMLDDLSQVDKIIAKDRATRKQLLEKSIEKTEKDTSEEAKKAS